MPNPINGIIAATLIVSFSTGCQESNRSSSVESSVSFDPPIMIETVALGPSPYFPDGSASRPTALSCHYFPSFVVKEHYLGGKGAEWLSILRNPEEAPECTSSHEPGERIIEHPEWEGYFMGAKGNLVFFDGSDTVNGGSPFAVYDALSGKKVFDDSAYYTSSASQMRVASTSAGYVLEYLRVIIADCNLNSEGAACWNEIKSEHALPGDDMPLCTGYDDIADLVGAEEVESVIAYPVEVTLAALPSIQGLVGPTWCWAGS